MSEQVAKFMDRSEWVSGPWDDEPDRIAWTDEATGYPCILRRSPATGAWCGYVAVPEGHPYFGKHYGKCMNGCEDVYAEDGCFNYQHSPGGHVEVHGGLTYADKCQGNPETGVCHVEEPGKPDVWWFGFDCGHAGDVAPSLRRFRLNLRDEAYRDAAYARREVLSLAAQLKALEASS